MGGKELCSISTFDILSTPRVYVLILNWNGWTDTVECLESVFRSNAANYRVIVCDNDSQDDSISHIKAWAEGRLDIALSPTERLREHSFPPLQKPIEFIEYDRVTAEAGGNKDRDKAKLVLIQTGRNLGFAGGNNVGLRYAVARDDFDYVWLLNNDTVVKFDTLTHMIARMQQMPSAGICGSTLLYYAMPEKVQALGGAIYNKWIGTTLMLGAFSEVTKMIDTSTVEAKMTFVSGASMLVTKPFLEQVGFLEENYFIYYEEIDWIMRAKKRFALCYASESIVYHKEGSSIGTNSLEPKKKSLIADYYGIRSRLIFTLRFFPWCLPFIYLGLLPVLFNRIRRRQWQRVGIIMSLIFFGWKKAINIFR